ncbi:MAG: 5-formyltetrahydrofolate cyclo-ligase [Hydrogenophilaceae bacterium]|nr:5-formyltetrahydrofolate cyclo-ligase [Hydrogenophilaceae bacterium]
MKSGSKKTLRKQLRAARQALLPAYRRQAARSALRRLMRSGLLSRGRRWGFYLPLDEEFDALPLLNEALHRHKECFLPVTANRDAQPLRFARLDGRHSVIRNRYGIVEPHSNRLMNARWLDMLIVPLVGFDGRGRRLGMGGGFYDATLAFLRRRRNWKKPYLIGLAFECQRVTEIPSEPWDIRLNAILTEKEFFRFSTQ